MSICLKTISSPLAIWGLYLSLLVAPVTAGLLDVDVEYEAQRGPIRVLLDGRPIVDTDEPLFSESGCTVDYRVEPAPGGFDVWATVTNSTDEPEARPAFTLSGIDVGRRMTYLDARTLGRVFERDLAGFHWNMQYPEDKYAPVLAAWGERFAVGLAMIYNPFEARHNLRGFYQAYQGQLRMGFELDAPLAQWSRFADPGHELQAPGKTSTYRIAVRFSQPDPTREPFPGWLDALAPYQDFFRETYGEVKYRRDLHPVMGQPVSQTQFQHEERNPRGFHTGFGGERVDLDGWGPYTDWLRTKVGKGYRRAMVWVPSGLYQVGSNYPPEFLTELPHKLVETMPTLMALQDEGVTIGMWWGRSGQVSGGWDTGEIWNRDLSHPADRQAAFDELDLAVEFGVNEVGLDAWARIGLWERYDWMQELRAKYPSLNLITESSDCDIMHTLAPTFTTYQRQTQRPILADWLVPGHETWIQIRAQQVNQANFDQVVSWNAVPVTMSRGIEHDAATFT